MSIYLLVVVLALFYLILNIIQIRLLSLGSDHFGYLGYILCIKKNKNRFIKSLDAFVEHKNCSQPQLYQWILSFFSKSFLVKYYQYINLVISNFSLFSFFIFLKLIFPKLNLDIDFFYFFLISSLIFILTPFSFASWNAKNVGLSARGLALLFVQLYLYFITLFCLYDKPWLLCGVFLFSFLILITGQFAFQFVLITMVFYSLFLNSYIYVIIPFSSLLVFYLLMPGVAKAFFIGQWNFKKLYYSYFAERYILMHRYSIWRDFIWDFWKGLIENKLKSSLKYIYRNPFVSILIGFPFLTFLMIIILFDSHYRDLIFSDNFFFVSIHIFTAFFAFFLTSFRKTRFLGEPDRYMEFAIPFISIFSVYLFIDYNMISVCLTIFCVLMLFNEIVIISLLTKKNSEYIISQSKELLKCIEQHQSIVENNRIFSNNTTFLKYFMGTDYQVLMPLYDSEYTGEIHIKDIFAVECGIAAPKTILPLIKRLKINWFILDTNLLKHYKFLFKDNEVSFNELKIVDNYIIYGINHNAAELKVKRQK